MRRPLLSFAVLLSSSLLLAVTTPIAEVHAQPSLPTTIQSDGTFENVLDGFRLKVPNGWVVQDYDNTDPGLLASEESLNSIFLAVLCMESESFPGIGGTYECDPRSTSVTVPIARFGELQSRPEFEILKRQNKTITVLDLVPLQIDILQGATSVTGIRVENITDVQVNATTIPTINSEEQQQQQEEEEETTLQAKLVELTYDVPSQFDVTNRTKAFILFVLSPDGNTGYSVFSLPYYSTTQTLPAPVQQIFDSFELLK